jgi:hypothetical protein
MLRFFIVLLTVAAGLLAVGEVRAQGENLLVNPGFVEDLSGWEFPPPPSSAVWDAMDVDASATSGSARVTNRATVAYALRDLTQCVAVTPGLSYGFGGWVYIAANPLDEGSAALELEWYDTPGCVGSDPDISTIGFGQGPREAWLFGELTTASEGAASARFSAQVQKVGVDGAFSVVFDDLFLVPEPSTPLLRLAALAAVMLVAVGRRMAGRRE